MICINPNRPDFRQLAEHHGVSVNKLEMITYKYRQMTGIEDAFPSELFIKSELGNIPYVESEPKVIELYNLNPNRYAPREFASADEAYAASEDFKKQGFPDQAFVVYPNSKGGYTLAVRKPIEKLNLTTNDILGRYTFDPQELSDFALVQAAIGKDAATLTEAQKIIVPQIIQHLRDVVSSTGKQVYLLDGLTEYMNSHSNSTAAVQAIMEEKEMQDIKDKAIANDIFMKAPNGKNTNLTERQWLQVRTKNFKKWFGDWENDPQNSSKVVDENGEPLVVYHGSKEKFTVFSKDTPIRGSLTNIIKRGFYFSNKQIASQYASSKKIEDYYKLQELEEGGFSFDEIAQAFGANIYDDASMDKVAAYIEELNNMGFEKEKESTLYSVFLNIKNPVEFDLKKQYIGALNKKQKEAINSSEGAILRNVDETTAQYRGQLITPGLYIGTDYIVFNPDQIKSATDNNGEFSTENDDIQKFLTPQGEIYGFVDSEGNVYLDETKISPEHPIHEYTHLWDRVIAEKNPKLWERGIQLMKDPALKFKDHDKTIWQEIEEDPNYGGQWQKIKEENPSKYESLIASEVHAKITGKKGLAVLDEIAKERGAKDIVAKLKQWLLDVWKDLKATFSDWSDEDIQKLTLQDFTMMAVRDFANKIQLNEQTTWQQSTPVFNTSEAEFYSGGATGADQAWGAEARALGINVKDYRGKDYKSLSQEWKDRIEAEYKEARAFMGKSPIAIKVNLETAKDEDLDKDGGILTRRDMMQADKADAIFAIAEKVIRPGESELYKNREYPNNTGHDNVQGGTSNAVARGIIRGIPVYVFDQSDNQWKVWNKDSNSFIPTSEPILTPHAATIGTRGINDAGRQAIKNVLSKTVNHQQQPSSKPVTVTDVYNRLKQQYTPNSSESKLLELVYNALNNSNVKIVEKDLGKDVSGRFVASEKTIFYNPNALQANTLLHELIHAATTYYLRSENTEDFPQEVKVAIEEIKECYNLLKQDFIETHFYENGKLKEDIDVEKAFSFWIQGNDTYGYTSPAEMVAELGKESFVEHIKDFDRRHKGKNIFQRLIDSIAKLFGINKTYGSLEGTLKKALTTILTNPSKELMDRYSQESTRIKENIHKFNESTHIIVQNHRAINELTKKLPESDASYADVELEVEEDSIPYSFSVTNNGKVNRMRDLRKGTILTYNEQLFMTLNGTPNLKNGIAVLPVRIYSAKALSLNDFSIKKDTNGIDYVENLIQQQIPQQQTNNQQQEASPDINLEHPTLTVKEQEVINQQLDDYDRINQQIDKLNDDAILSSTEVRHAAELIFNALSDMVTEIQQNKGRAQELFPSLNTELDFQTATRKQIIETIGIGRLLEGVKTKYFDTEHMSDEAYTNLDPAEEQELNEIFDNWDGVLTFGTDIFALNEGFGIRRNRKEGRYELTNGMHLGFESLNGHEDPDSIREQEDEQDHWQVEQRTIDIVSSATELVRQVIHGCYLLNSKGENISKYGINERVEPRKAIQSILTWTIGSQSIKEMVSRLKAKEKNHTWLTQLINRLNDSSGNEADFQSQFFNTMCKSYQSYAVGIKEDGSYAVIPVNDHPAASDILDNIEGIYQAGAHALFQGTEKKVDIKYLGTADKVSENDPFTLHKALHELQQIKDAHFNDRNEEPLTEEEQERIKNIISGVCKILGFEPSEEIVAEAVENKYDVIGFGKYEMEDNRSSMLKSLGYIVDNLDKAYKKQREGNKTTYTPFKYRAENGIKSDITNFLRPITDIMDETVPNVVYNDGKLYQGYVTPSYLTLLFEKFHWEGERFNEFIENTYGKSEWFFDKNGDARTPWLEDLTSANDQRMQFKHRVELNFNKHAYMKRMSTEEYTVSLITHYFSEYNWNDNKDRSFAWFRVPMQSNKPSSEFIRFYAETGGNYKDRIANGLFKVFMQEVSRIQTVGMRALSKEDSDYINNWDKLGKKFCFLPFLNDYIEDGKTGNLLEADNDKLSELLKKLVNREKLSNEDSSTLNRLVIQAIKNYNEQRANQILDAWETSGIIEEAVNVKNIMPENIAKATGEEANAAKKDFVRKQLENYIWNDHYAAINILELTIGDVAAYKNADDLQKRLAELHAPGVRPNIYATDYGDPDNGIAPKRVSDGIHRTVILEDWEDFKSNIIENISEICDRKIEAAPESQKKALRAWKEYLVGKDGIYRNINVADAQAFSSPSSYRKKALMFGRWSRKAEEVYQKLMSGDYNMTDLETAFQPLKPFVYGQIMQDVGIKGDVNSPIQTMPIPFQAKNAEYLLVMADAIIRGAEKNGIQTGKPNFLRAIYNVMEESERLNPTKGIDTVQFKSAIKSGLQGALNIHQFIDSPNGETDAYTELRGHIYKRDANGNLTSEYNTRTYVKEIDYNSYCLQQEVPDHFKNHSQAQGSQERMIIPSDLDAVDMFGNTNMYTWTDPDGTVRNEPASVVRKEYEETIADNINTDVEVLRQQLGLPVVDAKTGNIIYAGLSKNERNIALSKILQEEIEDSPRYGTELFQACQVDKATGNFRIPLGDPVQAKRIVQLLNSIIKNRVNKQEIAGGPVVQVSNFGASRQLKIRFNARSGGLLKLESEFTPTAKYKTYDEYKKAEQAGIAYFEVFAPAWSNDIFKYFTDSEGNVDITALELVDPNLLKMISYRIPTEDKYSIAPMKVVGFLPKEAGSAVMFPYELTGIDGSDYDVDKRYIIRKVIEIARKFDLRENESMSEAEEEYIENNRESIIAHLRDAIKLTANTTKEERDKVVEEEELTAASKRRAAERVHEENLDKIERRNSMMEDAEANVTFSANKEKDDEIYEKRDAKVEKSYNRAIEKENERYKAELAKIESKKDSDIVKSITTLERKKTTNRIIRFLKVDRLQPAEYDDALTRELRKAYYGYIFKTISYAKGKYANDNKIFEMTWGVLTNEMTADKILNPGGFDNFKKLAYLTAAYKAGKGSWNELNEKSISELKDLANENKDLTFIDTQIQFYKQNAAAASLIGVFAVHKIAHAVLEGNGIYIDVDEICETDKPFTIDGFTFDGRMEIDPKENDLGELIGKILGSGVGASADAVKDPCLDLLNINMTTINILNTAIRMSMPLESITKLLSQDVVTRLLAEYNRRNLGGYVQLDDVINEWLDDAREELQITEGSSIEYEDLTGEELIQGLRPDNNNVRTEYKTLLAFQRLKLLADKMRNPTFVTRFNSISSATGPQVVDNLITEQKIKDFTWNGEDSTGFYTAEGDVVDVNTILNDHPILKAFAQAYDIAEELFSQIPEGSNAFKAAIINGEEGLTAHGILSKVMRDKKLFDKLVNFYTTYLMVQAGLINPNEEATVNNKKVSKLEWYINEFPTVFLNKYKEKYKDNAFIQAISSQTSKKSNRTFLRIPLTGMEEQDKAKLRAAWTDLHKIDPDLSIRLATYWIFRGGIGFSPKTGTAVIPNYVKEHWSVKRSDGSTITYNDVYRMLESVVPDVVIDQFIRNNWNDNKLVPKKRGSKDSYHYSYKDGVPATLRVTGKKAIADIGDSIWIKTPFKNGTYLWKLISSDEDTLYFKRVMPLGDNNEYLEMSTENIEKPLSNTTTTIEDEDQTEIQETSTPNYDSEGNSVPPVNKAKEGRKYTKMAEIVYDYYTNVKKTSGYTMVRAQSAVNDYRSEDGRLKQIYGPSMMEALRHAGVKVDESTLEETVEKYCM